MAADIFIKIGDIKGESLDKDHKDWIEVESWSWGATQQGTFHAGGGGGSGKVDVHDFVFTKFMDVASPDLFLACANGKHHKTVEFKARKAGEKPLVYLEYKFEDAIISSIQKAGADGDNRPTESISLNFRKLEMTYNTQEASGAKGKSPKITWDISAHTK